MNADDFDFGLGDILQENDSGHTLARGGAVFLAVLFLALSSITTYMFFSSYAPGLGDWAGQAAAPLVAGAIGVLCLDLACIVWGYIRSRAATSAAQMAIALVISVIDLLLGLLTSGLYIVLSTTFETGMRDATGALTEFGHAVNWIGIGVICFALIGNFASIFAWLSTGADTKEAEQKTQLRATVTAGRHKIDKARTGQVVTRTIADIQRQLPAAVDSMAANKSAEYVTAKLNRGSRAPIVYDTPQSPGDMELEDLVAYLVEERLRERVYSDNGNGQPARPTPRPDGR